MHKGQVFSVDMLFGIILLIFGIGILIGAAEINFYNYRETLEQKEILQKAIIGAQIFSNSEELDCYFSDMHLPYSINREKLVLMDIEGIKQKTNLTDYKIQISINEEVIFSDTDSTTDLIAIDLNILTCNNYADFNMLKACMTKNERCYAPDANISESKLKIEVAK